MAKPIKPIRRGAPAIVPKPRFSFNLGDALIFALDQASPGVRKFFFGGMVFFGLIMAFNVANLLAIHYTGRSIPLPL